MLKKTDFKYLLILYFAWFMADYYAETFCIAPEPNPAKVCDQLLTFEDFKCVRIFFDKICDKTCKKTVREIKSICNDYLRYVLLPKQKLLKPFAAGDSIYEVAEALYVMDVFENTNYIAFDFLYIDNLLAYKTMRLDEQSEISEVV